MRMEVREGRSSKDHMNMRYLNSGPEAQDKRDSRNHGL